MSRYRPAIMIVMDNLYQPIYHQMLGDGQLPRIEQHIYDRQIIRVDKAYTCFPCSTFFGMQSLTSGMHPYDPGSAIMTPSGQIIRRTSMRYSDFRGYSPHDTIFDHIRNGKDESCNQHTFCIFSPWNDGADYKHAFSYTGIGLASQWKKRLDMIISNFQDMHGFTKVWLYASDWITHKMPDSYLRLYYKHIDGLIGSMVDTLKRNGLYDETLLCLVSDHSSDVVTKTIDLDSLLRKVDIPARSATACQTALVWTACIDGRINGLLDGTGIQHIVVKKEECAEIHSDNGSKISVRKRQHEMQGEDPFGYVYDMLQPNGRFTGARNPQSIDPAAEMYYGVQHPDHPPVLLVASKGYSFVRHKRAHGSFHALPIEFIIAGDDSRVLTVDTASIRDVTPTLLDLMGITPPKDIAMLSLMNLGGN